VTQETKFNVAAQVPSLGEPENAIVRLENNYSVVIYWQELKIKSLQCQLPSLTNYIQQNGSNEAVK